jgi:ribose/xylose/arabinose/galactoside ABC-type transport system permease subunit
MTQTNVKKSNDNALRRLLRTDEFSVFIPLVVVIAITSIFRPDFLTIGNFAAMFTQIPFIAVVALGVSFPLMTGNIDISTGKIAGFSGIMMASMAYEHGMDIGWALLIGLLCGVAIGLVNGILVVHIGLPAFIATMGTQYMVGGARYLFIHGYQLNIQNGLVDFFDKRIGGMLPYFWIMIVLYIIIFVVIKNTLWGRRIRAVGDNAEVASLAGINVKRMKVLAYTLAGFFSAIAGMLFTLDLGYGLPENGDGWEFRAIAGCVVGGVSLSGGKCSPLGIFIGVTLIQVAESAIIFLGMPTTMRVAVQGALMAAAVLFDIFRQSRKVAA